jgi:hypothetical protein
MVWIGGPRRRRGLYLHDPPPGYHPPRPRMPLKDRQTDSTPGLDPRARPRGGPDTLCHCAHLDHLPDHRDASLARMSQHGLPQLDDGRSD